MSIIYLGAPYSHPDQMVRIRRYMAATRAAARLMEEGNVVFSPLTHSHPIAMRLPDYLLMDHKFWMKQDLYWLRFCDRLVVLTLDGWQESKGLAREIAFSKEHGILVDHMEPIA